MESTLRIRRIVCVALMVYCAGVFNFALWPTDDIRPVEVVCAILACFAFVGLAARALGVVYPGVDYIYLVAGLTGLNTLFTYLTTSSDAVYVEVRATFFLAVGVIGSYGAFLAETRMEP